ASQHSNHADLPLATTQNNGFGDRCPTPPSALSRAMTDTNSGDDNRPPTVLAQGPSGAITLRSRPFRHPLAGHMRGEIDFRLEIRRLCGRSVTWTNVQEARPKTRQQPGPRSRRIGTSRNSQGTGKALPSWVPH